MRRRHGACIAAVVLLVAGCGGSSAPSDDVPALGDALGRVDDAIVEGRYDDARTELDELVATTTTARDDGELEGSEADRILAAVAQLMSALPTEQGEPAEEETEPSEPTTSEEETEPSEPTPSEEETEPSEPTTSEPAPEESSSDEVGSGEEGLDEEAEKEAEELEKEQEKLEKEQEKLEEELQKEEEKEAEEQSKEEGGGNGDSSENGPDDGEGN